jgi:hypothetical protein
VRGDAAADRCGLLAFARLLGLFRFELGNVRQQMLCSLLDGTAVEQKASVIARDVLSIGIKVSGVPDEKDRTRFGPGSLFGLDELEPTPRKAYLGQMSSKMGRQSL